jgi:phage-related protein
MAATRLARISNIAKLRGDRVPNVHLVAYQETDGSVPLRDWLDGLPRKAQDKCRVRLERLAELGHDLRRPEADLLRDGIHELRTKHQRVNYRMLYFFQGRQAVIVSHGFSKQQAQVPPREIDRALRRKQSFESDPAGHTFDGTLE